MKSKNITRIFSFVVCVAMVLCLIPVSAMAVETSHDAHSSYVTHVEAVAGNCTTPGNIEFWYCSYYKCDKCYSDEAMTQEISPADVVLTPKEHSDACVGCQYANIEKTFDKFVPAEDPDYDEEWYFGNGGFDMFSSKLEGFKFLFVGEDSKGELYAMGNKTNADGSRNAVKLTDYLNSDGSVTIDSDTAEFFTHKRIPNTYTFSPDNGYMSVFDGKIVVHGENLNDIDSSYSMFPQSIRFEQNKEDLTDYVEDKGYLFCWALNTELILFDDTGAEPEFKPVIMWGEDENGETIENRTHNIMLYKARCTHENVEHTASAEATCTKQGIEGFWYCNDCRTYYSDAQCTEVLELPEYEYDMHEYRTIPASGHKYNDDGICENCDGEKPVYNQIYTIEQFDEIGEDESFIIVFKDEETGKAYAASIVNNPLETDTDGDGTVDAVEIDENANDIPDYFEAMYQQWVGSSWDDDDDVDKDDYDMYVGDWNGDDVVDIEDYAVYIQTQGTEFYYQYAAMQPNYVEVNMAQDGTITLDNEGAMEFQFTPGGIYGGDEIGESELPGIENDERIRAAWIPNYWVAFPEYADRGSFQTSDRIYGDDDYPGVYGTTNWSISFRQDGSANLVFTYDYSEEKFDRTAALQLVKYDCTDNEEMPKSSFDDMPDVNTWEKGVALVGMPQSEWEWSDVMANSTARLSAYLFTSQYIEGPPHECQWSEWTLQGDNSYKRECTGCGESETMVINTDKPVNNTETGTNAANTNLSNTDIELIENVLSDEEQSKVAQGAEVKVYLRVEDISENTPDEHKAEAEAKAGDDEIGMYLDIELFKQVGESEESQVTETSGEVAITITIPEELINTDDSVTRNYKIIRVHEDENGNLITDIIDGEFNHEDNSFTFKTDKFSTYALVYSDIAVKYGDVNNDTLINKKDDLALRMYLADLDIEINMAAADMFYDGTVNKKDLLLLKQYLAGLGVELGKR